MNIELAKQKIYDKAQECKKNKFDNKIHLLTLSPIIDKIYDDFEKDLKEINNQVSRLKTQLSKDHHIECSCSFCKPVYEKVLKEFQFTSCDDCKNKIDGTYQETCSNCKRFYGCYFEKKEM